MKFIKRTFYYLIVFCLIIIIFKGWLYRNLIEYRSIGIRPNYDLNDENFKSYIHSKDDLNENREVKSIIKLALSITSNHLNFTAEKNNIDPNKLFYTRNAHCIGYASFFSTTCNYLFEKNNLSKNWIAKPEIGQLYIMGNNIHTFFNSPFFKDHDFVIIENRFTNEYFVVDPTIHDYFSIDFITYKK